MTDRTKILVFCPTAPRLESEVVESIFNQDADVFYDVMFTRDNPYVVDFGDLYRNVQLAYEKARELVVTQGYDKLWIVESDTIPPHDALRKLLAVDADVVSGLYALRHGYPIPNITISNDNTPRFWESNNWKEIIKYWGQTRPMDGGCMGCLLVDKKVLSKIHFTLPRVHAPDTSFMTDCIRLGFKQMACLDVICGHKRPNGEILWPDRKLGVRIEQPKEVRECQPQP